MPVSSDAERLSRRLPRWRRGGRPQHGLRRARRAHPHRRRRPVVPLGRHARHRPGAAGLRLRPQATPTASRRSCSRTVTRTTSARCRTCSASSTDRAGLRHAVHARAAEGQARGARVTDRCELARRDAGRGRDRRPVLDAVPARDALDPRRHGGRDRHAVRHDPAHRRLQDRPDAARRAAHRPARSRRGGERPRRAPAAVATPRTPRRPATPSSERSVGPVLQRIVENAPEIVVAACFSSHIHRDPADRERGARERARRGVPRPVDAELGRAPPGASGSCRSTTATWSTSRRSTTSIPAASS